MILDFISHGCLVFNGFITFVKLALLSPELPHHVTLKKQTWMQNNLNSIPHQRLTLQAYLHTYTLHLEQSFSCTLHVKRGYTVVCVVTPCLSCKTNADRVNLAYRHCK